MGSPQKVPRRHSLALLHMPPNWLRPFYSLYPDGSGIHSNRNCQFWLFPEMKRLMLLFKDGTTLQWFSTWQLLWGRMTFPQGLPETIRRHRDLHFIAAAKLHLRSSNKNNFIVRVPTTWGTALMDHSISKVGNHWLRTKCICGLRGFAGCVVWRGCVCIIFVGEGN